MLPHLSAPVALGGARGGRSVASRPSEYLRRIFSVPQMDFEYTFWQMKYLLLSPSLVYRTASWHKQTKNQWARDDPAFVLVLMLSMGLSSLAYAVAFHSDDPLHILRQFFYTIFVDFFCCGMVVATLGWWATNRFLRAAHTPHNVEQRVEWLYCVDIHCNSFYAFFVVTNVLQYLLLPALLYQVPSAMVCAALADLLYAGAFLYYIYITFLGYHVLPFLTNTRVFLTPAVVVAAGFLLLVLLRVNLSVVVMNIYYR